jgi:hypothetical protein
VKNKKRIDLGQRHSDSKYLFTTLLKPDTKRALVANELAGFWLMESSPGKGILKKSYLKQP